MDDVISVKSLFYENSFKGNSLVTLNVINSKFAGTTPPLFNISLTFIITTYRRRLFASLVLNVSQIAGVIYAFILHLLYFV